MAAAQRPLPVGRDEPDAATAGRDSVSATIAARALANAILLPLHSAHRFTGHAPGEPQRSQSGGANRISAS